jgi:biopolymer transport protein ExbD
MDMVEAPVVAITPSGAWVDNVPTPLGSDEVFNVLRNKRQLWQQLSPAKSFPGQVILQIDRDVPAHAVKRAIQIATRAGYPRIAFQVRRRNGGAP